jgi:superoxide dismutase, Fe-Mn family
MPFTLPELPYDYNALEPHIDARTMEIHHTKHHQTYIDKLNAALEGHGELQEKTIEELLSDIDAIPEEIRTAVRNHGGGHANHTLFWTIMGPQGAGEPASPLAEDIHSVFGSFSGFASDFSEKAAGVFGSGWAWLVVDNDTLAITTTPNQDSPLMSGQIPILGLDVWEHGYYLTYQNRRPDYIAAWWNVVNWQEAGRRYEEIKR